MTYAAHRKRSFFIRDILSDVYSGASSKQSAEKLRYRTGGLEPFLLSPFSGEYLKFVDVTLVLVFLSVSVCLFPF